VSSASGAANGRARLVSYKIALAALRALFRAHRRGVANIQA
jgi:hypothetical protein